MFIAVVTVLALTGLLVRPSDASIEVDLSVLDDSGVSSPAGNSGLRMPGTQYPRSEYFGPPVKVSVPVPTPAPKPEPEPKAEEMAAPEPEPVPESEPAAASEPSVPEVAVAPEPESQAGTTASTTGDVPPPPPEPAALDVSPTQTAETAETGPAATEEAEPAGDTATDTEVASTGNQDTAATRIVFVGEDTRLPDGAEATLDPVAAEASADDNLRIQLRAYAGGDDISASKARRLSLSRALAVRSYLIEQGVRSTRIDVRALGDKVEDEPVNRVDIDIGAR